MYNLKVRSGIHFDTVDRFHSAFSHPALPLILNDRFLDIGKWGLIPSWVRDDEKADDIVKYTLNARIETLESKPSFKGSVNKGRCLVMFDGFYEWQHSGKNKIPYYVTREDGKPLLAAGLISKWSGFNTFTIITTNAMGIMREVHNSKFRMPYFINEDDMDIWLDKDRPYRSIIERIEPVYNVLSAVQREPVR